MTIKLFNWMLSYVNVKGLGQEIIKRTKTVDMRIEGEPVDASQVLLFMVARELEHRIGLSLAEEMAREAKIELELKKTEKALQRAKDAEEPPADKLGRHRLAFVSKKT